MQIQNKTSRIIIIIWLLILFLLIIYFIYYYFDKKSIYLTIPKNNTKIIIKNNQKVINLIKKDNQWQKNDNQINWWLNNINYLCTLTNNKKEILTKKTTEFILQNQNYQFYQHNYFNHRDYLLHKNKIYLCDESAKSILDLLLKQN